MDTTTEPLRTLLDRGQRDHAEQAAAYADALMSRNSLRCKLALLTGYCLVMCKSGSSTVPAKR